MWHGPTPSLEDMLEVVPDNDMADYGYDSEKIMREHKNTVLFRFNLDGTDEIIYKWIKARKCKDGSKQPGFWLQGAA